MKTQRTLQRLPAPALALGVLLAGCPTAAAGEDSGDLFERHEVVTGAATRQTVLTGFFRGAASAEIAVVEVDENRNRRLRLLGFDGRGWTPVLDAPLPRDARFVDVADIAGRDRLVAYQDGRFGWFDPETATLRPLVDIAATYEATGANGIPHLDIARDLNQDGLDDLAMPASDGFWIAVQSSDGTFAAPVKLGPPEPFLDETAFDDTRSYGEVGVNAQTVPWYLSRIHQMDYDRDGRVDLVFWNEDHFEVHLQNERGLFEAQAEIVAADVPFDADGAYSFIFGFSDESLFALVSGFREKTRRTVLHALGDLNGDGVADLVTHTLSGRSLIGLRSRYAVHFGRAEAGGTAFARDAGAVIEPRGSRPLGYSLLWLQDLDGDGQTDATLGNVRTGLRGMLRAMLGKSIAVNVAFYRMADGGYPEKPSAARSVRPKLKPLGKDVFFPTVLLGDVDGDGRSDLLLGRSWQELDVFLGVPGPGLFAPQPRTLAVAVPHNEANARLADLNRDGRQDLILIHPSARPSAAEPHRLTLLIAR